jgi:hypothetical protein
MRLLHEKTGFFDYSPILSIIIKLVITQKVIKIRSDIVSLRAEIIELESKIAAIIPNIWRQK